MISYELRREVVLPEWLVLANGVTAKVAHSTHISGNPGGLNGSTQHQVEPDVH
jgi:hypothetical protein